MKLLTDKSSGRIYARLKTGRPAQPYVKMSLGTTSPDEARRKARGANLAQIEAALQLGPLSQQAITRLTVGRKLTLTQAIDQWLAGATARGEAPSSTAKSAAVLRHWLAATPDLAARPPLAVTTAHLHAFINRPAPGTGASARRRQLAVLRQFFRWCVDLGYAPANIAHPVKLNHRALSHAQKEKAAVEAFTAAEVKTILAGSEGWDRWSAGIAAAAGLRLGDIAQLEHAALAVPGHLIVHTAKRDRRVRLPINDRLTPGLAEILAEIPPGDGDSPYVFPAQAAQYEDIKTGRAKFSVYFGRLLDRLGIARTGGRKSFHSLRHHAITRWRAAGFSLEECRDHAGHGSTKTTEGYIKP